MMPMREQCQLKMKTRERKEEEISSSKEQRTTGLGLGGQFLLLGRPISRNISRNNRTKTRGRTKKTLLSVTCSYVLLIQLITLRIDLFGCFADDISEADRPSKFLLPYSRVCVCVFLFIVCLLK